MICDFKKIIKKYKMISRGDRVVIGLSGGADSMTLLHLFNEIKDELDLTLVACHVNHLLRGNEAYRDMDFVKTECEKLNVHLETIVFDVKKEALKTHESFEECGRRIRYDFFKSISGDDGKIATAHNLCDNEETVFLNLIRGTGISGLKGIPYVRGNVIRPLLDFSRRQIEDYCSKNSIPYVNDSTNNSDEFRRNYIRHNVLPKIKELEPSFDISFKNFISLISDDVDFINSKADELIDKSKLSENCFDVEILLSAHKAVLTKSLAKMIYSFCEIRPEKSHIDLLYNALNCGSMKVQITGGIFAVIKRKKLSFIKEINTVESFSQKISLNEKYNFFGMDISVSHLSQKVYKPFANNLIDCDKIIGDLYLRNRREGDKITLTKRNVTKTLKKLFSEDDISLNERERIPVLSDDEGVVWVMGYGCTKRCAVDSNSKNVLIIEF